MLPKVVLRMNSNQTIYNKGLQRESFTRLTGAEAVICSLLEEGVDTIFGYPGGAIMPIYDALYDYEDKIRHVLVRHEQGAIHAAQGFARVKRKAGVCFATSGPGATNLVTGLADAQIDSTPLVCITGQVNSSLLGSDAFQETDIIGISTPVTKWNYQVKSADEIPKVLAKAFYIAQSGRPGPVLVDITKDAQFKSLDFFYQKCKQMKSYSPKPALEEVQLSNAARAINRSSRPIIFAGQGVLLSGAETELLEFVNKTRIPVASTLLGLGALPSSHHLNIGLLGMHGNFAPNKMTNEADLLIAIGMRFDDRVTGDISRYALSAEVVHIEIDPGEIHKNIKADWPVLADAKEALAALLPIVYRQSFPAWMKRFESYHNQEINALNMKRESELRMKDVLSHLSYLTEGNACVVTDVGQHQMIAMQYMKFEFNGQHITSGGLGTMGFSLPAALGVKIAHPEKQVIAIMGDGGFQMNLQELATVVQEKLPLKIMVLNNSFLGMVRQWQEMFFDRRYAQTKMNNPDFVSVATSFGLQAYCITNKDELGSKMQSWLNEEGPSFLEVKVKKEDNVFPMVPSGASVSEVRLN